ncbi:nitrate reductase [Rhodobacter sp. CZR27]|uniref:nitrate reductase n=1 Tax=Rhodobacter sp. CZR27 TaxID=2033869 RepID=UPI001E3FF059|nr:nitrate reductase [Rhodobacter sp. CZR27]
MGIPIGMIWSWFDYGAFELGYMSNHVVGAAFFTGLLTVGAEALRRRFSRHEGGDA